MPYAIETVNLVKRYPTTTRQSVRGRGPGGGGGGRGGAGGGINSFSGLLNLFRRRTPHYVEALRGINLQINEGEVFGLLGPNGAGKTTLIKILCTLVIHDEGEAFVNGLNVKKEPDKVLQNLQAILPESRGFDWRLTGRQNLAFYALLYGVNDKEARERIDYLLNFTGLTERANDGYQRYSTGMQRKLLLCRALLRNTPTILFDEPTSGLDPAAAAEFRTMLRDKLARQEGKTVMISTHNLNEAQSICDRIAILHRGKILACDTPQKVQQMVFDKKIFSITLNDPVSNDRQIELTNQLNTLSEVKGVTPETDLQGNVRKITIDVDKEANISGILTLITGIRLPVNSINTEEPSLEDVFMSLTREQDTENRPARPGYPGGPGSKPPRQNKPGKRD